MIEVFEGLLHNEPEAIAAEVQLSALGDAVRPADWAKLGAARLLLNLGSAAAAVAVLAISLVAGWPLLSTSVYPLGIILSIVLFCGGSFGISRIRNALRIRLFKSVAERVRLRGLSTSMGASRSTYAIPVVRAD